MTVLLIQNDFTHGEVDPQLLSRVDLGIYNRSAQRLRNCIVTQTGAATKRFGTDHISSVSFGPAITDNFQWSSFRLNDNARYIVVFYSTTMTIYKHNDNIGNISQVFTTPTSPYTNTIIGEGNLRFAYKDNLLIITHEDVHPYQLINNGSDGSWSLAPIPFKFISPHDFKQNYDSFTFSLGAVTIGTTTLNCSNDIFDSSYVEGTFIGIGPSTSTVNGIAIITSITSAKIANVSVQSAFDSSFTGSIAGTQVFLGQPAWNSQNGYPVSCTFYEGRLWFGGTASLPRSLFGSVSNDYRNFNIGRALDSDSISAELSTNEGTEIEFLVSDKNLQIFCTNDEFIVPQFDQQVITPTNISVRKQDSRGISRNISPIIIDNTTLFIQKGGKSVYSFGREENTLNYISSCISRVSSHIIGNPIRWGTLQGSNQISSDFVFAINQDGSLLSLQLIEEENVRAWTLSTTSGSSGNHDFVDVLNIDNFIYFIVKRNINGTEVYSFERLNFDIKTDNSTTFTFGTPSNSLTGLQYLEGETVNIVADGFVLFDQVVPSSGNLTIEIEAYNVEVGLSYSIEIQPNPINIPSSSGPTLYIPKNIPRIFVDYYQSLGLTINGNEIPDLAFSPTFFDQAPELKTGIYEYTNVGGWDRRQSPIISSDKPLSATILGIGYEVVI